MNRIKKFFSFLIFFEYIVMMEALIACSQDIQKTTDVLLIPHTMKVKINVTKFEFNSQENTRSGSSVVNWKDGEVIHLYFDGYDGTFGIAKYDAKNKEWTLYHNGGLIYGHKNLIALYFDEPIETTINYAKLSSSTGIYADWGGSYSLTENGDLSINLNLKPQVGRIRFQGKEGTKIYIDGITTLSAFTYSKPNYIWSKDTTSIELSVDNNGYTPYIYGSFSNKNLRQLKITNGNAVFTRTFSSLVFDEGESGWLKIPTRREHEGWKMETDANMRKFTVTGNGKTVSFTMKLVEAGTFYMGSTSGDRDEMPVHLVTLPNDYLIGETEVTQALWYAVMGQSPTSREYKWKSKYGLGDNYPAYEISYEDCQQFLTKLNQMTGVSFRFPTEAEWEFAARGGNSSEGYTYAGSNTIDDIAWYVWNAGAWDQSSDYGTHQVATKAANELGLYDMSGNVSEWCYDWYASYSSDAQTNPTGPTIGYYRVLRGGNWIDATETCRTTHRSNTFSSMNGCEIGFRLALSY